MTATDQPVETTHCEVAWCDLPTKWDHQQWECHWGNAYYITVTGEPWPLVYHDHPDDHQGMPASLTLGVAPRHFVGSLAGVIAVHLDGTKDIVDKELFLTLDEATALWKLLAHAVSAARNNTEFKPTGK